MLKPLTTKRNDRNKRKNRNELNSKLINKRLKKISLDICFSFVSSESKDFRLYFVSENINMQSKILHIPLSRSDGFPLYSKFAAPFNLASVEVRRGVMCLTIRGFNKANFAKFSQVEHCSRYWTDADEELSMAWRN